MPGGIFCKARRSGRSSLERRLRGGALRPRNTPGRIVEAIGQHEIGKEPRDVQHEDPESDRVQPPAERKLGSGETRYDANQRRDAKQVETDPPSMREHRIRPRLAGPRQTRMS